MNKLVRELDKVLKGIHNCKRNSTCPELRCRKYYFEPNSQTIDQWHKKGLYKEGIDTRVMFVCESPGGLACNNAEHDDIEIVRCWDITEKDEPFFEVRHTELR